jgi:hypothetical protein
MTAVVLLEQHVVLAGVLAWCAVVARCAGMVVLLEWCWIGGGWNGAGSC